MKRGISLISLIITMVVIIILAVIVIFMPDSEIQTVNYKAIIQVGKDEYVTVDVADYYIYESGMIRITSKDGRTYRTSNYTLIENLE